MFFSIIVVCLNPGDKLEKTLASVREQTFEEYEVILQDGGSKDGSLESATIDYHVRAAVEADAGIYDAMNKAISRACGRYLLFLNCGDTLYGKDQLEKCAEFIEAHGENGHFIFYGDTYYEKSGDIVTAPPEITPFGCYRNIPCHQSCLYHKTLFDNRRYDLNYKIRADYEHFLYCFFTMEARPCYMGFVLANYEGGGFSESKQNLTRDKKEHQQIAKKYFNKGQLFKYRAVMVLTLAPLRKWIAEKSIFSGVYHKVKAKLYHS